jgi:hypothetical protein
MFTVEEILEQRDVDAALYLLNRMLGVDDDDGARRHRLVELRDRIKHDRKISGDERGQVVAAYREVIG